MTVMKIRLSRGRLRDFVHSREGAIAVIFALLLGALGGMMALAMDLGRAWNLETELQHAADACALAGATQLDGSDGARARAVQTCSDQVALLVQNEQTFASDGLGVDVTFNNSVAVDPGTGLMLNPDIKFYVSPLADRVEATTDAEATYIEANVAPRQVDFAFAALVGAVTSATPRARAVAGFESFYCDSPPMMMCNPAEPLTGNKDTPFDIEKSCPETGAWVPGSNEGSCVGKGISMKTHSGGGNAKLGPGDWGYLSLDVVDPDTGEVTTVTGASALADALASVEYSSICTGNEITTRPGNVASLDRAINERFDLYWDSTDMSNSNRQPARQTKNGLVPDQSVDNNPGTIWDPNTDGCRFNPVTGGPNPGVWSRPKNFAGDRRDYRGPGEHNMVDTETCSDLSNPGTCSAGGDGVPDPFVIGPEYDGDTQMPDPPMGLMTPPIRAMAFPKDYCAYPSDDGNGGGVEPALAASGTVVKGVEGCRPIDGGIQMGSGQFDAQIYLDVFHPGVLVSDLLNASSPDYADLPNKPGDMPDGKLSRWEIYNWEKKATASTPPADFPNMPFEGKPQCYRAPDVMGPNYVLPESPATASTVDRRIIVMAVVNCAGWDLKGKATVERTKPDGNIGVFLTEPMGYTDPDTMYGEIVDPRGLGINEENLNPDLVKERILLIE